MSLKDIASLGRLLAQFLSFFSDCFETAKGRRLFAAYVRGLLSSLQRKNVEAIALDQNIPPRTLQRFLESIKWDQDKLLRKCQKLVAKEFSDPEAIGVIDETGTAKSGNHTVGVGRQYNGNRGKIENAIVAVALSYATPVFHCLVAARMYLPEYWANDSDRRKKTTSQTTSAF
ncbi:transposase [Rubripirellula amarantea]|nr:transposase [Rubripirellula amarantea]